MEAILASSAAYACFLDELTQLVASLVIGLSANLRLVDEYYFLQN